MSLANKLRKFRQQCERDAGTNAANVEIPLSHVLYDVCTVLKLSKKERQAVLGQRASSTLGDFADQRVELNTSITRTNNPRT